MATPENGPTNISSLNKEQEGAVNLPQLETTENTTTARAETPVQPQPWPKTPKKEEWQTFRK